MSRSHDHDAPSWLDRSAYSFQHHWFELSDGPRMHFVDEGHGDPILFVHGTPTWSFEWRDLIRGLAGRYRCVAPDHLGFGLSDRPADASYTPEAHAQRLQSFVRALDLRDITLVVHDYGGPIGLPLCFESESRVRRVVIINTWMWSFVGDRDMESKARIAGGRVGRFLYRYANFSLKVITPHAYADRKKLTPEIHRQYLAPFPDTWSRGAVLWPLAQAILGATPFYESLWQARGQLRHMPALIVWGMKDPAFQPNQLARWNEVLPDAQVVKLSVGHWPHEEAPDAVLNAIRSFLAATPMPSE